MDLPRSGRKTVVSSLATTISDGELKERNIYWLQKQSIASTSLNTTMKDTNAGMSTVVKLVKWYDEYCYYNEYDLIVI